MGSMPPRREAPTRNEPPLATKAPNSSHDAGQSAGCRSSESWEISSTLTSSEQPSCRRRHRATIRSGEAPCLKWSNPVQSVKVTGTLCTLAPSRTTARNSGSLSTCWDLDSVPRRRGATILPRSRAAYRSTRAGDDVAHLGSLPLALPKPRTPRTLDSPPPSGSTRGGGCRTAKGRPARD